MRVTSVMMGRNYKINLGKTQSALNDASMTMNNYRKFQTIADDPAAAARAFQLRQEYSKLESYKKNAENAQGRLDTADSALQDILTMLNTVKERIVSAANGTWGPGDREIMATEIQATQKAILQNMNLSFTGQYVFGGTQSDKPPLTIGADGRIRFQGMPLDDDSSYSYYGSSAAFNAAMQGLMDQKVLLDFGYGIDPGDPASGFDVSLSAARFLDYDVDSAGMSNNLYNLLEDMSTMMANPAFSQAAFAPYLDKFNEVHKNFLTNVTDMAAKSQSVNYTLNRIEDSILATTEKQNYVEFVDPAEAVIDWKWQEFAYRSALAIGQQILQPSLLDYLR